MRKFARLISWFLRNEMGINPRKIFKAMYGLPRFARNAAHFKKNYQGKLEWVPCLTDWNEEGGAVRGEYFWQDLYVARKIYGANPRKHIDIGSRVDGFVAHVASFREIEVFDIRPISASVPGIVFRQADLMKLDEDLNDCCDSISCLHALEHFGLGRYGDPINVMGYEAGLQNMSKLLRSEGVLYLSVPIGIACVQFNAHRVFDPKALVVLAERYGLKLSRFAFVDETDSITESMYPEQDIDRIALKKYALGIFIFRKVNTEPCFTRN
jgi:SAM-dependent methyltransferase